MRQRRACGAGWPAAGQVRLVADGGRRADGRQGEKGVGRLTGPRCLLSQRPVYADDQAIGLARAFFTFSFLF
jgi:hypothetical protein